MKRLQYLDRRPAPGASSDVVLSPRPSAPVLLWAAFGIVVLVVVIQGWLRWVTGSDFTATPRGDDPFGGSRLVLLRFVEFGSFALGLALCWRFLIRSLVRDRTLTFDGMLVIASITMWFWDPVDNYFNFSFVYNAHFINFASWTRYIPGWDSPNQHLFPEPVFFMFGIYLWWILGAAMLGCAVLRTLRRRYPTISVMRMMLGLGVFLAGLDFVLEMFFARNQLFIYPGTVHTFTVFTGRYYQFPLYEPVCVAIWCSGIGAFRYFRDDRGLSFAERGVEQLRIGPKGKKAVSLVAVLGLMHAWFIVGYFFPYNAFAIKSDTFPPLPSYLRAGICGTGTDYACPSEHVPVPSRTSLHITPDDPRLPPAVRDAQGIR